VALFRLIYSSRVARQVRFADVEAIVQKATPRNTSQGLTGILVYTPSHFLQVLEGEEAKVRTVLARITLDPRHSEVRVIDAQPVAERKFASWAMVARQVAGTSERDFRNLTAERALDLAERARDT
jgi:hypothetical protein